MKEYMEAGRLPGHEDYLPACWEMEGHPDMCRDHARTARGRWICTREAGHEGDHAAHGGGPMLARWPQKEEEP